MKPAPKQLASEPKNIWPKVHPLIQMHICEPKLPYGGPGYAWMLYGVIGAESRGRL
jgi:hypothetical protein